MTVRQLMDLLADAPPNAYVLMEADRHLEPAEIVESDTDVIIRYDDTHFLEEPIVVLRRGENHTRVGD